MSKCSHFPHLPLPCAFQVISPYSPAITLKIRGNLDPFCFWRDGTQGASYKALCIWYPPSLANAGPPDRSMETQKPTREFSLGRQHLPSWCLCPSRRGPLHRQVNSHPLVVQGTRILCKDSAQKILCGANPLSQLSSLRPPTTETGNVFLSLPSLALGRVTFQEVPSHSSPTLTWTPEKQESTYLGTRLSWLNCT